jgi:hypothetical protein
MTKIRPLKIQHELLTLTNEIKIIQFDGLSYRGYFLCNDELIIN